MSELTIIREIIEGMRIGNAGRRKYKKQASDEEKHTTVLKALARGKQFRISGGTLCDMIADVERGEVAENIQLVLSGNRSHWTIGVDWIISKDFKDNVFVIIAKITGLEKNYKITIFPKTKKGYVIRQDSEVSISDS